MCASVKCNIRACLLQSGASPQQEETAIDSPTMWTASVCWDGITKTMVGENHQRESGVFRRWKDSDLKTKAKWQHRGASQREVPF